MRLLLFVLLTVVSLGFDNPEVQAQPAKEITNSVGMKLVLITKGKFLMGSPPREKLRDHDERQHEVAISRDYYLGAYEVTQGQYSKVMGKNPSHFQGDKVVDSSNFPVENVSWEDAIEFCRRLSSLPEERKAGRVYRLPTEAEWEYGCRAGSKTAYGFGDDSRLSDGYGWFVSGNSSLMTHPVGQKKANAWGLYDMHGNVWEWCSDWYGDYPREGATDPTGPTEGSDRVERGGSWFDGAAYCRSANRSNALPSYRDHTGGFRLALSFVGVPAESGRNKNEYTNSVGMKLVLITKGKFLMGSPPSEGGANDDEKQHEVTISRDYYLGAYEVTQGQYLKVMGKNPSYFQGDKVAERHSTTGRIVKDVDSSNFPVERVSWEDAIEFCRRLSSLPEERKAGRVYRLPTEAEWEYGCRAGSKTAYGFGDDSRLLDGYGWFFGNSSLMTHPVGQRKANAWGLYDMHGNVLEWCSDWYGDYPREGATDPTGPTEGSYRVIRGGGWGDVNAADCRAAYRARNVPTLRNVGVGFRLALSFVGVPAKPGRFSGRFSERAE